MKLSLISALFVGVLALAGSCVPSQRTTFSAAEQAIEARIGKLRSVPDAQRGSETKQIALAIRKLPASTRTRSPKFGVSRSSVAAHERVECPSSGNREPEAVLLVFRDALPCGGGASVFFLLQSWRAFAC